MNDYIYMLYRIKHHDCGMWGVEPFHVPIDTKFFSKYIAALRTLVGIRKYYRKKGYTMEFVTSPIYPEKVKTASNYTYMCTYLVHPLPDKGKWYEYIILKCPIYAHDCKIIAQ